MSEAIRLSFGGKNYTLAIFYTIDIDIILLHGQPLSEFRGPDINLTIQNINEQALFCDIVIGARSLIPIGLIWF